MRSKPHGKVVRDTNIGRSVVASWDFYDVTETGTTDTLYETSGRLPTASDRDLTWFADIVGTSTLIDSSGVTVTTDHGVEHPSPRTTARYDFRGAGGSIDDGVTMEFIFRTTAAVVFSNSIIHQYGQSLDMWRFGFNTPDFYYLWWDSTSNFVAIGNGDGGPAADNTAGTYQHMVGVNHVDADFLEFYYQGGSCGRTTWGASVPMPTGTQEPRGIEMPIDNHSESLELVALRVYDRAFSQAEVSQLRNNFQAPLQRSTSESLLLTLASQGSSTVNGTASATVTSSASADPNVITLGVASATVTSSATASGGVGLQGTASATVTSSAAATANVITLGVATATVTSSASASGAVGLQGTATATVTSSASAGPTVEIFESATATVTSSATAIGNGTVNGTASATVVSSATAAPNVITLGVASATAASSASASPNVITLGVASATVVSSASATGTAVTGAIASATVTSSASADPNVITLGVASATVVSSASATGVSATGPLVTATVTSSATATPNVFIFGAASASVVSSASVIPYGLPVFGLLSSTVVSSASAVPAPPWVADVQAVMPIASRVLHVMNLG